jgi:hypothetical protein
MTLDFNPFSISTQLVGLAICLQSIELLAIRASFNNQGIWRWNIISKEFESFSPFFRFFLDRTLSYPNFLTLLLLRTLIGGLIIFYSNALLLFFLLITTLLIAIRWRGTFNGGSDYMTVIVLTGLTIQASFPDNTAVALGSIFYITVHTVASYFIAGIFKLKSSNWRDGSAVKAFLASASFDPPQILGVLQCNTWLLFFAAWSILLFECSFPLAVVIPQTTFYYLFAGAAFHLLNSYLLGLNRFFMIWLATYPMVLWCATNL